VRFNSTSDSDVRITHVNIDLRRKTASSVCKPRVFRPCASLENVNIRSTEPHRLRVRYDGTSRLFGDDAKRVRFKLSGFRASVFTRFLATWARNPDLLDRTTRVGCKRMRVVETKSWRRMRPARRVCRPGKRAGKKREKND